MFDEHIRKIVDWTKLKIRLHRTHDREVYFREKEVWWASLGANIGNEENGKHDRFERPVLIIKKFSRSSLCVLPLSSKVKKGSYFVSYYLNGVIQTVLLSQIRTISSKRLLRKMGVCPTEEFEKTVFALKNLF